MNRFRRIGRTRTGLFHPVPFAAILLLLAAGCERDAGSARDKAISGSLIAVIGPSQSDPRWPAIRGGARRYLDAVRAFHSHLAAPDDASPDSLRAVVDDTLARRPQVVCLWIDGPADRTAARERILASGTLLITVGASAGDNGAHGSVSIDRPAAAAMLGDALPNFAADRRAYLLLSDETGEGDGTPALDRFRLAARTHPGFAELHIPATLPAAADAGLRDRIEHVLSLYPRVGLLITLDADAWMYATPAWLQTLHESNPDFRFATTSTAPTLWKWLGTPQRPGPAAALVGPLHGDVGFAAAEVAAHLLLTPERDRARRTVPCEVVTAQTLRDFALRYARSAGDLDVEPYLP